MHESVNNALNDHSAGDADVDGAVKSTLSVGESSVFCFFLGGDGGTSKSGMLTVTVESSNIFRFCPIVDVFVFSFCNSSACSSTSGSGESVPEPFCNGGISFRLSLSASTTGLSDDGEGERFDIESPSDPTSDLSLSLSFDRDLLSLLRLSRRCRRLRPLRLSRSLSLSLPLYLSLSLRLQSFAHLPT